MRGLEIIKNVEVFFAYKPGKNSDIFYGRPLKESRLVFMLRSTKMPLPSISMGNICKCKQLFWTVPNSFFTKLYFKAIWDWIILCLTFYTAIMVPYNVALKNKTSEDVSLLGLQNISTSDCFTHHL